MRLGIVVEDNNNWTFFDDIYRHLSNYHPMSVFEPTKIRTPFLQERIQRVMTRRQFTSFINSNDVTIFEWAGPLLGMATRLECTQPLLVRLHSYELYEWAPQINWSNVSRVILVSQAMRRKFVEMYPDQVAKTEVIVHGVDLEVFSPPSCRVYGRRIGMMAKLVPIKRIYEMILVVYKLHQRGLDYELIVAGPPAQGAELRYVIAMQQLTKKLGLEDSVTFQGYIKETAKWYHGIDIFVSNSYWEGAPVSLMEAMACGCYCLAHVWDGAEEMLPANHLFITDEELISKITLYDQSSESMRDELIHKMRDLACEKFDIQRTCRDLRHAIKAIA